MPQFHFHVMTSYYGEAQICLLGLISNMKIWTYTLTSEISCAFPQPGILYSIDNYFGGGGLEILILDGFV